MRNLIKTLIVFSGIIIGGYLGTLAASVPALSFLAYGKELGLTNPLTLDLSIIKVTFGFMMDLNIASIIGLVIALIVVKKV